MQLGSAFFLLLASVLVILSVVQALPITANSGIVTLPLKRLQQQRSDLHPMILLQQQVNRSHRRYARMSGRQEPSTEVLAENLMKRYYRFADPPSSRRHVKPNTTSNLITGSSGFPAGKLKASGLTPANTPTSDVSGAVSLGLAIEGADVGYVATVQLGTPARDFNILMDSGSADFWVGGDGCITINDNGQATAANCGNHTLLGSTSSSSFKDTGVQFSVTYGSGAVVGNVVTDNVVIGGLTMKQHTFGVALGETVQFSGDNTSFDGLMGLAKSSLSQQNISTPVEQLASLGLIKAPITSYKISRLTDGKNDGEITFGGLDSTKFNASTLVSFENVNLGGFWEGAVSFAVNGKDVGLQGRTAILDTGTTMIIAPPADAVKLHAMIPGSQSDASNGVFTIPCTTTTVVSLNFGGANFDINATDLLLLPVYSNNLTGTCISGIMSGSIVGAREWLVGDVFLKNVYYSTDVSTNNISLAKLV